MVISKVPISFLTLLWAIFTIIIACAAFRPALSALAYFDLPLCFVTTIALAFRILGSENERKIRFNAFFLAFIAFLISFAHFLSNSHPWHL